mgnify:CR=1 FL=1
MEMTRVIKESDFPPKLREFDEKMMEWYHNLGMHLDIDPDKLLELFPTYMVRIGSFTLVIQSGGEKYPKGFSLSVFNEDGVIVDDRNYMSPGPDEIVPERWPHGAIVVDGRKPMDFVPRNPEHPKFVPPQ